MREKITFSFGKNWQKFLKTLNEEKINYAKASLEEFLGPGFIKGKTFLDIGCGSGLFSYAAHALGASKVVSFDVDPFSVKCCHYMHGKALNPPNWEILSGSVLDGNFVSKLGTFDIVYSWGVLHHTGRMREAILNASKTVKQNGAFYIAIYNRVQGRVSSETWLKIKKFYNFLPGPGKFLMDTAYFLVFFTIKLLKFQNPVKLIKNYKSHRGMSFWSDISDWLGGYPYEFASVNEITQLLYKDSSNFRLARTNTTTSLGNNEFLFFRT